VIKMKSFFLVIMILIINSLYSFLLCQESGSIWIKTFKPGSANLNDETIDKQALTFVDSLMKRDGIEVLFLGGADRLKWKSLPQFPEISTAFDQAKKLERASRLQERYGWGEIGITNETFRGIKVVWSPKRPDPFEMKNEILQLQVANDSLLNLLTTINQKQNKRFAALHDSLINIENNNKGRDNNKISLSVFDWEIKTGLLAWVGAHQYDLSVPCIGIALKRQYWAFEIQGGFTPWSRPDIYGDRGDALIMGTISMLPQKFYEIKTGVFSGWEFLSKTDQWTMKVLGLTIGPCIKWKFIEGYAGYTLAKLSTLTASDRWASGIMLHFNFRFLVN